jgi:hypothetical protein
VRHGESVPGVRLTKEQVERERDRLQSVLDNYLASGSSADRFPGLRQRIAALDERLSTMRG